MTARMEDVLQPQQRRIVSDGIVGPRWLVTAPPEESIELRGDSVAWVPSQKLLDTGMRVIKPARHVFRAFLRLHDQSNDQIIAFAKRHGVLGLCTHGLPICHPLRERRGIVIQGQTYCVREYDRDRACVEPLDSWRALSRAALALITLKEALESDQHLEEKERKTLWAEALWPCIKRSERTGYPGYRALSRKPVPEPESDEEEEELLSRGIALPGQGRALEHQRKELARQRIALIANEWLQCSGIVPRVYWQSPAYHQGFEPPDGPNLFSFVAAHLCSELAVIRGWDFCTSCGVIFEAENTIGRKRRKFCPACRKVGRPQLFATRDYRKRKAMLGREA
jgi:hypothetical protein